MGKKYKRGNRKRKSSKNKDKNDFYKREREINKKVSNFINTYYHLSYPPIDSEYEYMNNERIEIKRLFDLQDGEVWKQSTRRKRFYYKQLNKFKYYYVAWKSMTYYIFLEQKYNIPRRFCTSLSFFRKNNNCNINNIRFQL